MTAPALRRDLTAAEQHVDIRGLVAALERAKHALHAEIVREQRRVARNAARGRRGRLVVTPRMAAILEQLYHRGRRAALEESRSMGAHLTRRYEAEPAPGTERGHLRLQMLLRKLSTRVNREGAAMTLHGEATPKEVVRALAKVPGAMDAAGRVVSMTLTSGLSDVYEANEDAFNGWQYTAVLDGGTCEECAARDGEEYDTLEEGLAVLPNFGPNPDCHGEDRCRCRLLPLGPSQTSAQQFTPTVAPEPEAAGAPAAEPDAGQPSSILDIAAQLPSVETHWADDAFAQRAEATAKSQLESARDTLAAAPEAQRDAVRDYTGSGYVAVNSELRRASGDVAAIQDQRVRGRVRNIDRAVKRHETTEDTVVYRGFSHPDDPASLVGQIITDQGYFSTSASARTSEGFAKSNAELRTGTNPVLIRLHVRSGEKVAAGHAYESELIMRRGSRIIVIDHDLHPTARTSDGRPMHVLDAVLLKDGEK